jgi:DNA-binding NtrC family response regulator
MRTILVVDDKPGAPAVLQAMLEQCGRFQVLAAASPREALQIFARMARTIDLVIAEVSMAGISGPCMAATMSAIRPNMPVVFISRVLDRFDLSETLPETRYAFQPTPSIPSVLVDAVDRILSDRRLRPVCAGVG